MHGARLSMKRIVLTLFGLAAALSLALLPSHIEAQQPLTWDQVKARFESANPTLKADALGVDEAKAQETTAYLRPNPQFAVSQDGTQIAPVHGDWQPLVGTYVIPTLSYLHDRDSKRELRLQSAQEGTRVAT